MKRTLKIMLLMVTLGVFMQSCDAIDNADLALWEAQKNGTEYKNPYACPDGTIFRKKGAAYGCYDDNRRWF